LTPKSPLEIIMKPGLYIISTPIGNMGDITTRGLETLKASDHIFAEDTRVTKKLLEKHGIRPKKLGVYNDFSDEKTRNYIKELIEQDLIVSLVSDAGTPLISDPGYKLVRNLQDSGHFVDTTPGPSAPIAALTLSGLPTDRFMFNGFIPKTIPAKEKLFSEISSIKATMIFFETASRLISTLEVAHSILGDREACVAREITKMYQEVKRDRISGLIEYFTQNPARGEIVFLISGEAVESLVVDIEGEIRQLLQEGNSAKTVATLMHIKHPHESKSSLYQMANRAKR
jgi:16S rRNA (cytidine1402-2'-O)-methyltransferase